MAVNKVIYNKETLIDLTSDTVTENTLIQGTTAHKSDGTIIEGNVVIEQITRTGKTLNIPNTIATAEGKTLVIS